MTLAAPGDGSRPPGDGEGASRPSGPVIVERAGEHPRELLERAGLAPAEPRPVIVVCGGADDLREPELTAARQALVPALREAVASSGAAVVDGGTAAGVMALLGAQRGADPESLPVLLGVAPAGQVERGDGHGTPLAAHHTHFVLADSDEWGGETALLTALAAQLAQGEPIVVVLAGGGAGALAEVEQAVALHWPVLAIAGTGGLAERIAGARGGSPDPELATKLEGGDVRLVAPGGGLGAALAAELRSPRERFVLDEAWRLFATYDGLAVSLRKAFERFQISTLVLGVVATAIAILHDRLGDGDLQDALRWLVIAAPIGVSVLIAVANRRGAGKRWVLLRAAAEAVKSEIYRYRTRTGVYSRDALRACEEPTDRPLRLAGRLTEIEAGLIKTDASGGSLPPYKGPIPPAMYGAEAGDDGFTRLDAERYVAMRIVDQLGYYRGRVASLDRSRGQLQLLTLVAGGVGTLLAAVNYEIWIGVTTAVAAAALAHLGYMQVENTLVSYNRAAAQLAALQREFHARGARRPDVETLVTRGEKILMTELSGWVQQMSDALAQLQDEQAEAAERVKQDRDAKAAEG